MSIRAYINLVETLQDEPSEDRLERLRAAGFDVEEPLYHGTKKEFSVFNGRNDIYTSPDEDTAADYGPIVYECYGRQDPQCDLTDEGRIETWEYVTKVANSLAENYLRTVEDDPSLVELKTTIAQRMYDALPEADRDEWTEVGDFEDEATDTPEYTVAAHAKAAEYVKELITSGSDEMSGTAYGEEFQGEVISTLFNLGCRSVRFYDKRGGYGGYGESVVFPDKADIVIVRRVR